MSILDQDAVQRAVEVAKSRFGSLCKEFPALKGYLVLHLRGQQTGIGSSGDVILKELPLMVVEDHAAAALRAHLKERPDKDKVKDSVVKVWEDTLKQLIPALSYHGHIQVEMRFNRLDYALLDKLRPHPLVDTQLTPQTKASIRIVLGTLDELLAAVP